MVPPVAVLQPLWRAAAKSGVTAGAVITSATNTSRVSLAASTGKRSPALIQGTGNAGRRLRLCDRVADNGMAMTRVAPESVAAMPSGMGFGAALCAPGTATSRGQ